DAAAPLCPTSARCDPVRGRTRAPSGHSIDQRGGVLRLRFDAGSVDKPKMTRVFVVAGNPLASDQRSTSLWCCEESGTFRAETLSGRLEPGASRIDNGETMQEWPLHDRMSQR